MHAWRAFTVSDMRCTIKHETPGRLRVHMCQNYMTLTEADMLELYLSKTEGVKKAEVHERTCDAVILYTGEREDIISALSSFHYDDCGIEPEKNSSRALMKEYEEKVFWHIARRGLTRFILPAPIKGCYTCLRALPYLWKGLKCLGRGKIEVAVLDATTVGVSLIQNNYDTAGSIMFLLGLSEILEEWTHKKTVDDLARSMSLNVDKVWMKTKDGEEVLMSVNDIREGDLIVLRTSNMIPLDGIVEEGEASVNQASMTGESVPVHKSKGAYVYAGTVMEEGECIVKVKKSSGEGRYDRIVKMIEESEKLKSSTESRAVHLSDGLVPYSFLATGLTYLFTRNVTRALSVLMVDYSCALKLSMPISVLSAMRECSEYHISVKGGKFLEAVSDADTIVFDKTGTLTYSEPRVAKIITFGKRDETEMLRLAACLEEHYPHSIANAVVKEAQKRNLIHEEKHSRVEYVVAHGIASSIDEEKVIIGSYHFVFEDEGCTIPRGGKKKFDALEDQYSHLYMAIGGKLAAVIEIEDPIREEAPAVMRELKKIGFEHTVMMTGDSERTAKAVAAKVGLDEYHAEVLPEDKADYVKAAKEKGRGVIMIGDGINDSLALSEADCGIAISNGAAIAREIADVTVADDSLEGLVTLREVSDLLMDRIHFNYRFIMGFNSALIALGIFGIIPPTTAAYLHNASTLAISMKSMTPLKRS